MAKPWMVAARAIPLGGNNEWADYCSARQEEVQSPKKAKAESGTAHKGTP